LTKLDWCLHFLYCQSEKNKKIQKVVDLTVFENLNGDYWPEVELINLALDSNIFKLTVKKFELKFRVK